MTSSRGSGVVISASCFSFIGVPYASTSIFSTSAGEALPVRTAENSWLHVIEGLFHRGFGFEENFVGVHSRRWRGA